MSSQEQRSNISPLLVGEPPASSPFMNGPASSSPMVGTLKGACSKNQHGYSVAYGPDRFQLPEVDPTNPSSTPSSSSTPSGCAHHHNHSHHHLHHHHSHRDTAEHTNGPDAFSPQHYHHHYQQIGNDVAHSEEAERTLQKNQRNRMPPASGGGHEYQQLTLQAPQSRRAISSDDSQPNSVEVYQPQQNVHDTTNSDSDYLSSNLNLGANGRGCCQHKCRCENAANARRDVEDGNRPGGSQDPTARTRRKKLLIDLNTANGICPANFHRNEPDDANVIMSSEDEHKYNFNQIAGTAASARAVKNNDATGSDEEIGPPLPPRPPPRQRFVPSADTVPQRVGVRKYVVWCLICGGLSCLLGVMFLGVYFLVRSYTSTVGYFETVPTFVPATLLMLTGLCIMSLARRRNRYSYLIKLSGACGLASALTCALVTVTTTVLHMSRLQSLRECEYTKKTRTCTCYPLESSSLQTDADGSLAVDESLRFVFDSSDECTVVHGALYSCLRAVFGLSVAGVLVAVFSCMLVYQLLSHERKKMYWEQLELRCRSLYAGPQGPPPPPLTNGPSIIGTPRNGPCRCCEQCHSHRTTMMQPAYPWDGGDGRFWAPAPGAGGNFYSPNPGGDEHLLTARSLGQVSLRGNRPGWSWPRLPWQRNDSRFRNTPSSPDSQYGFSNAPTRMDPSIQNIIQTQSGYTVISGSQHYGVWGPPPPYSDPNSPARRGRMQCNYPPQCQQIIEHQMMPQQAQPQHQAALAVLECHQQHSVGAESVQMEQFCQQPLQQMHQRNVAKKQAMVYKPKECVDASTPSDSDNQRENMANTLPFRKAKKRVDAGAKSIGSNQQTTRINVQNVFNPIQNVSVHHEHEYDETGMNEASGGGHPNQNSSMCSSSSGGAVSHSNFKQKSMKKQTGGVENTGFQAVDENKAFEPPESEVYFADVSSCCNTSLKNDVFYDDGGQQQYKQPQPSKKKRLDNNEDYLVQRFGKREASVRSRLPFPQALGHDYDKSALLGLQQPMATSMRNSMIAKDLSRQSMCSMDSGEKTDFTDLSPATPCGAYTPGYPMQDNTEPNISFQRTEKSASSSKHQQAGAFSDFKEASGSNFVALFPYSSNEQSQEAHRRTTKNLPEILMNSSEQFDDRETASGGSSASTANANAFNSNASSASSTSYQEQDSLNSYVDQLLNASANSNTTPSKRSPISANISAIIQNISDRDVGLLYGGDSRLDSDIEASAQPCEGSNGGASSSSQSEHNQIGTDRRL